MSSFLENQYSFYNSYHNNQINKGIHIVFIPLIIWSLAVFLTPIKIINIPLSKIIIILYTLFYIILKPQLGIIMYIFLNIIGSHAYNFYYSSKNPLYYAGLIQIFSWMMQFAGHYVFEGNSPALFDGTVQSFIMAPLFVIMHVLEFFGIYF